MSDDIWIGLAHVKPRPRNEVLGNVAGAYVACVGLAHEIEEYFDLVVREMDKLGLDVIVIEDIEFLADRMKKFDVSEDIIDLAEKLDGENRILFNEFHTYKYEEH